MSITLVTTYAPSGKSEQHTHLNAVDLVRNCGYSFQPGKQHAPTDGAPYARPETGKLPSRAQEALDSVGTGSEIGQNQHIDAQALPAGAATSSESILNPASIKAVETAPAPEAPAPAETPVETAPAPEAPAAAETPAETPAPAAETPAEKPAAKPRQQRPKKGAAS